MTANERILGYPLMHQYAQGQWHDESLIYATREGLLALRDAIDAALKEGHGFTTASPRDGECYTALVVMASEEDFAGAQPPYTDPELFAVKRGRHPGELPGVVQALEAAEFAIAMNRQSSSP